MSSNVSAAIMANLLDAPGSWFWDLGDHEPFAAVALCESQSHPRGQFLIDAVEPAIRQDCDHIAGPQLGNDRVHDRVGIGVQLRGRAGVVEAADHIVGMQALGLGNAFLLVDAGEDDPIRQLQAGDDLGLQHFAPQRIGARLEHRPRAAHRGYTDRSARSVSRMAVG